jgi:ribosomal protein S28E/S33
MLKVFSEKKKKIVLFEQVVGPVDIDNVLEMEKSEALKGSKKITVHNLR